MLPMSQIRPTLAGPQAPIVTPLALSAMSAPDREWDTVPVQKHTDMWSG